MLLELIQGAEDAPPPVVIQAFIGLVGTAILGVYIAVWDGPRWAYMVEDELTGSYGAIVGIYAVITLSSFLHNITFYTVAKSSAVLAGVVRACVCAPRGVFLAWPPHTHTRHRGA